MDQGTDNIRQNIEETRASLDSKLNNLENRANDASGTVREASQKVLDAIDIRGQVVERPWTALGVAVAAGYVLGSMGSNDEPNYERYNQRWGNQPAATHVNYSQQSEPDSTESIDERQNQREGC